LFRPFVVAGLVVTVVIASLTLLVNPWASGAFQGQLFKILQARAAIGIQERTFSGAFGQVVLYVEEASPSQLALKGVLASDERNPQLSRIIIAREGRLLSDDKQRRLTLRFIDGSINETDVPDPQRFRYTSFSLYDMNLALAAPATPSGQEVKPEKEMPLRQLIASTGTLRSAPKETAALCPLRPGGGRDAARCDTGHTNGLDGDLLVLGRATTQTRVDATGATRGETGRPVPWFSGLDLYH
jgi:lipopolysaccharide export LptBFGC system permease protein LptF